MTNYKLTQEQKEFLENHFKNIPKEYIPEFETFATMEGIEKQLSSSSEKYSEDIPMVMCCFAYWNDKENKIRMDKIAVSRNPDGKPTYHLGGQ